MRKAVWGALIIVSIFGTAAHAADDAADGPARQQPADAGRWAPILDQLASPDFAQRQAGQKALGNATWRDRDALQKLADASDDPEVKDRLMRRVEELDEQIATNPPPISLDLRQASFPTMVAALGKALDLDLQPLPSNASQGAFTLHAVDKSFPEIFLELSRQGGIRPVSGAEMRMMSTTHPLQSGVVSGGFLFFPLSASYERSIDYQNADTDRPPPRLTFSYSIIADPRIRILQFRGSELTSVLDSAGHELLLPSQGRPRAMGRSGLNHQWTFQNSEPLDGSALARQIGRAKGVAHFTILVHEQRVEIPDMQKQGAAPIRVGDRTITFSSFLLNNRILQYQASTTPGRDGNAASPLTASLVDASGRTVSSSQTTAGTWGGTTGNVQPPIKGIFTVATKTKDIDVPFEFRNVPLP